MSTKELDRATMLQRVANKTLTQKDAAQSLGITDRQLRRLMAKYRAEGSAGLAHQARGKPSNHRLPQTVKDQAIELVRTKYPDFGPTFAAEKLAQLDGIKLGAETLRGLMITAGMWQTKQRKATHRLRRERRALVTWSSSTAVTMTGLRIGSQTARGQPCSRAVMMPTTWCGLNFWTMKVPYRL